MYPSSLRMRAISIFKRDAGTSTLLWRAVIAFPMRVSISEIGSVMFISVSLPTRFSHTRNLPVERQLAEADAADAKLADVSARTAAPFAAIVAAHFELWSSVRLNDL